MPSTDCEVTSHAGMKACTLTIVVTFRPQAYATTAELALRVGRHSNKDCIKLCLKVLAGSYEKLKPAPRPFQISANSSTSTRNSARGSLYLGTHLSMYVWMYVCMYV